MIDLNLYPTAKPPGEDQVAHERRLEDLRRELQRRAPALVREIFPAAQITGHEARIGDLTGAAGESLSIELTGERAGLWKDFATGEGGDLIDLWRETQGYKGHGGFMEAVGDLEQHLGMSSRPAWTGAVARVAAERAKAPKPPDVTKTLEETYVYRDAEGDEVARVLRYRKSDGGKTFRQQRRIEGTDQWEWKAPETCPLFQVYELASEATVILVEGEKCARALRALGLPATTAIGGAEAILEKTDWEPLRGKRVILWPDNDAPGHKLMGRVQTVLRGMDCDVRLMSLPANLDPKWDAADEVAKVGGDRAAIWGFVEACLTAPATESQAKRFVLIPKSQILAAKPTEWLIEDVLPVGSFASVVAPPDGYKSFLAVDWSLSVANGKPWHGRKVRQGSVVYIAAEGYSGLGKRIAGWDKMNGGAADAPFLAINGAVDLPEDRDLDDLMDSLGDMPEPPALIVIDTLIRSFGSRDENSSKDMSAFVRACDRLKAKTGATILVIHHTGKDVERGARGSNALLGGVDVMIAIKRRGKSCLTLINRPPIGKQKDAEPFDDINLITRTVEIGTVNGKPITTLVLELDTNPMADGGDPEVPSSDRDRPSPNDAKVLAFLTRAQSLGTPKMGLTSIAAGTGINKGTIHRVLARMVEVGLLTEDGKPGERRWQIAIDQNHDAQDEGDLG